MIRERGGVCISDEVSYHGLAKLVSHLVDEMVVQFQDN